MTSRDPRRAAGRALALLSALFYSTRPVLVRFGLDMGVGVPQLAALRMIFGAAVFLVAERLTGQHRLGPKGLWRNRKMVYGAACFSGAVLSSFYAVALIGVSLTALIVASHPVFVALYSRLFLGRRLGPVRSAALAAAYGGCILMSGAGAATGGWRTAAGCGLALATAGMYAAYQLLVQDLSRTAPTLRIGAATAYLSLLPALALWHFVPLAAPPAAIAIGAALGFFSTFLPIVLLVAAIERIGAVSSSLLSLAGPFCGVTMGWLFFGEALTALQLAGAAVLLASVGVTLTARE